MTDWLKELSATNYAIQELEKQYLHNTILYKQLINRRMQILTRKFPDIVRPKFSS